MNCRIQHCTRFQRLILLRRRSLWRSILCRRTRRSSTRWACRASRGSDGDWSCHCRHKMVRHLQLFLQQSRRSSRHLWLPSWRSSSRGLRSCQTDIQLRLWELENCLFNFQNFEEIEFSLTIARFPNINHFSNNKLVVDLLSADIQRTLVVLWVFNSTCDTVWRQNLLRAHLNPLLTQHFIPDANNTDQNRDQFHFSDFTLRLN